MDAANRHPAARPAPVINPDPVDEIRQDNAHRVGAPNHHHNTGSGENPMVGNDIPEVPHWAAALLERNALLAGMPGQGKSAGARCVARLDDSTTSWTKRDALAEGLAWEPNTTRMAVGGGA